MVQISPLCECRLFDIFTEDDDEVPIVGSKRGHIRDLDDPGMSYDKVVKRVRHDSIETTVGYRL